MSIDRVLNWLSIIVKDFVIHDMRIYLESITGSIRFHTQTATLYP